METPDYQSFVVRAWARHGVLRRASVEAVQAGVSVDVRGEAACRLLASLDAALAIGIGGASRGAGRVPRKATLTREGSDHD